VVDVDVELGLVRVVELATTQEVGRAMNPQALEGQIEGGSAQGLGLALLEEIQVRDGKVLNASFTDYLLPTILDMPPVRMEILEHADPIAPYGLKGVGEPPNISTPPAVVAALRDATGRALRRMPVRPQDIVGLDPLDGVFEGSPWVAEGLDLRSLGSVSVSVDAVHAALMDVVRAAPLAKQLELIRAHPELGARHVAGPDSAREQAAAGLASRADDLRTLNAAYRERFGFPLIVFVREHSPASILAWGRERLHRSGEEEIETALGEISKIARARLEDRA
jgi:OHCU decarboxylase